MVFLIAMSRALRIEYKGAFHHVISRGYDQKWIFLDEQDFDKFFSDLNTIYQSHGLVIHAYCIMNNHFHLFTETPNANLQQAMHRLLSSYASYFKTKYKQKGKVFEKRYKGILVETDAYALDLTRYIHLNPVGPIVQDPASWKYSSYRSYLGYDKPYSFLDTDLVLNSFAPTINKAREKLSSHTLDCEAILWDPEELILGKSILGSQDFLERIQDKLPTEINTEISGLIKLKSTKQKADKIMEYINSLEFDQKTKTSLLVYSLRTKTDMRTLDINQVLNSSYKASSLSYRVNTLLQNSKKDAYLAQVIDEIRLST